MKYGLKAWAVVGHGPQCYYIRSVRVKINFNDNVTDDRDGIDFVIQRSDVRLLAAERSHLFQSSISGAKLYVAWVDIIYTQQELQIERIII